MIKKAGDTNPKTELMQTATIGAAGLGTGMLASKIGKAIPSIGEHAGKMGALIGGMGLLGDYAAVKINKALEKKASNAYLEKAAETYSVKGHGGVGRGHFPTPNLQLTRPEYHNYEEKVHSRSNDYVPLIGTIPGAILGAKIHHKVGPHLRGEMARAMHPHMRHGSMSLGAVAGYHLANHIMKTRAHNLALEDMDIMHPALLKDKYKNHD